MQQWGCSGIISSCKDDLPYICHLQSLSDWFMPTDENLTSTTSSFHLCKKTQRIVESFFCTLHGCCDELNSSSIQKALVLLFGEGF